MERDVNRQIEPQRTAILPEASQTIDSPRKAIALRNGDSRFNRGVGPLMSYKCTIMGWPMAEGQKLIPPIVLDLRRQFKTRKRFHE